VHGRSGIRADGDAEVFVATAARIQAGKRCSQHGGAQRTSGAGREEEWFRLLTTNGLR